MNEWHVKSKNILKSELARRGISYEELKNKLAEIGIKETVNSLRIKVSRGKFSFAFFLQCVKALQIKSIHIED